MGIINKDWFLCDECEIAKPLQKSGGTGYAGTSESKIICYECCAIRDRADMIATGKATLYLSMPSSQLVCNWPRMVGRGTVGNWPGTLKFNTGPIRVGRHTVAGRRYDVYFSGPDGHEWHGVQYGDNTQICHCRRLKAKFARKVA